MALAARLAIEEDPIAAILLVVLVGAPLLGAAWLHFVRGDDAAFASLAGGVGSRSRR